MLDEAEAREVNAKIPQIGARRVVNHLITTPFQHDRMYLATVPAEFRVPGLDLSQSHSTHMYLHVPHEHLGVLKC